MNSSISWLGPKTQLLFSEFRTVTGLLLPFSYAFVTLCRPARHHRSPPTLTLSLSFLSYFCFLGFKSSCAVEFQYDLFFLLFKILFSLSLCLLVLMHSFLPVVPKSRLVFLSLYCLYCFHCWYLKLCPFSFFVPFFVMDKTVALKRQMTRVAKLFYSLF